jgi:hypothetical protein
MAVTDSGMVKRGPMHRSAYAVALLAVALFSLAFTQSVVMQAAPAMPDMTMAICTSGGLVQANADHGVKTDKAQKACPFCAAATQAPLCASTAAIPQSSAVAWTAYMALRPLGPRGPPARAPNARGPPPTVLTI